MPKRPPSLHFSLRPRRASQIEQDEAASPGRDTQPGPSSPSTPASPTTPGRNRASFSKRQAAARASVAVVAQQTRAEIRANLRTDWQFPTPPEVQESARTLPESSYVEREVELSSPSRSPSPPLIRPSRRLSSGAAALHPSGALKRGAETPEAAYRFENPDAVGDAITDRMKCWRRHVQQECKWNPGLRHWEQQRDAWTGAAKVRLDGAQRKIYHRDLVKDDIKVLKNHAQPAKQQAPSSPLEQDESDPTSNETLVSNSASSQHSGSSESVDESDYTTLVPLAPPLLAADHPIRSQIQPRNYRNIYTKIVAQGTAPSVPVNLRDIVSACVAGWKADGEWPPKSSVPEQFPVIATGQRTTTGTASQKAEGTIKTKMRNRIGSIVGHHEAPPLTPLSPTRDDEALSQEPGEVKGLGIVERGVRRMSRVLKMVGGAMIEHDDKALMNEDGPEVPGLLPESDETVERLKSEGLV